MRQIVAICGQIVFAEMSENDEGKIVGVVMVVDPETSYSLNGASFSADSISEAAKAIRDKLNKNILPFIKFYEICSPNQPVEVRIPIQ